jgi:hypothetical protein
MSPQECYDAARITPAEYPEAFATLARAGLVHEGHADWPGLLPAGRRKVDKIVGKVLVSGCGYHDCYPTLGAAVTMWAEDAKRHNKKRAKQVGNERSRRERMARAKAEGDAIAAEELGLPRRAGHSVKKQKRDAA